MILNEKEITYANELQISLEDMVRENQAFTAIHEYGGQGEIFVLRADQLSEEERVLLQTTARAVLLSIRGTLAEQLMRHPKPTPDFIQPKALSAPDVDTSAPLIVSYGSRIF